VSSQEKPSDKDPLATRVGAVGLLVALPFMILGMIVNDAPWWSYPVVIASVWAVWAIAFKFRPWFWHWVRGDEGA
jgi:membrane protein YdbS with pleckstrin-like domain